MNCKNIYRALIIVVVTIVGLWAIPSLLKIVSTTSLPNQFVYYSSVLNQFTIKEMMGKQVSITDKTGNIYGEKQYDSITPLLNFRQLMLNNTMPDSINGRVVPLQEIRTKSFVFKYTPKEIHNPEIGLYILYEALSGKVKLESPGDVFRLDKNIEFIDAETNQINAEKSKQFQEVLIKEGYIFPAQWTAGNLNIKKSYDEGYFSLDAEGKLYHIKMVNNRPYVRNTKIGESVKCKYFSMLEVSDKRFYGFLFDDAGAIYTIELQNGTYTAIALNIPPIDMDNDEVLVMGNMLYWTIYVKTTTGKQYYALNCNDLSKVDDMYIADAPSRWEKLSAWVMPYYFTLQEKNNGYIQPYIYFTALTAFIVNILLALFTGLFLKVSTKQKIYSSIYVLLTGIAGALAIIAIPTFNKINK